MHVLFLLLDYCYVFLNLPDISLSFFNWIKFIFLNLSLFINFNYT